MRPIVLLAFTAVLYAGCGRQAPVPQAVIQYAVHETMQALTTSTPQPFPSPNPSVTAVPLQGIFCEYEFCIGHPKGLALFDVVAKQNPSSPEVSQYEAGKLATYGSTIFIQLVWKTAPANSEPEHLLDLVIDDSVDMRSGQPEALTVTSSSASIVPLETNATELLPYGVAAAWVCGGRGFVWKAYSNQAKFPRQLMVEALQVFRCAE